MTRKDYELIAEALNRAYRPAGLVGAQYGVMLAAHRIADALAATNPRFDRERFIFAAIGETN